MQNLSNILNKCLKRDREAQQQLYYHTYNNLATAVATYSKDKSERDWIFNLGMFKIYSSLERFQQQTNYLGWARTILVRTAIDHIRSNNKHSDHLSPVDIDTQEISSDDFETMMNALETDTVIEILQKLPERERLIFSMYELDGYTHKEIENITGIKSNTSKWLLSKSKKTLRDIVTNSQHLKTSDYGE